MDEELWTFEALPKIGMQLTADNLGSLKELIDTCMSDPRFQAARDQARAETWENKGNAVNLRSLQLLGSLGGGVGVC